ncbi:MAG: FAD-binding protein [Deltaproteobacteria bacterium]|nr:FAD-binding protein [Deltaproteobacteria bacterium]
MQETVSDILIIGGGAAGCFAAIKAKQAGASEVLIVDKGYVGMTGCSKFAAGSFKCFIPGEDDFDLWFSKAVEEGYYINDQVWTRIHLEDVFERAKELEDWGLRFLKDRNGRYQRLEGQGSSSQRPIKTMMFQGPELMDVLRAAAKRHSVRIMDRTMVTHLLHHEKDRGLVAGALGFDLKTGRKRLFKAKAVILCTGAQAYKSHYAYQKMVTGDGHVMGLRAGALIKNYEFTCHHLSCAEFDTTGMNVLQGIGARFINSRGEQYMRKYDPEYGDHASMNRLSAAMACEVRLGNGPLYFDFSLLDTEALSYFRKTLPIMYKAFERAGYIRGGRIRERLEWVSVNMGNVGYGGGLDITTNCETSLRGLYAAGDATCGPASGVEGFSAYAIPFAVTSGARSGLAASEYIKEIETLPVDQEELETYVHEVLAPLKRRDGVEPDYVVLRVQETIFPMDIYLLRDGRRLEQALDQICRLRDDVVPGIKAYDPHYLRMAIEASNMVACAELFLRAAIARTESRGSHLREDFPNTDNINWIKWVVLQQEDGRIRVSTEPIPVEKCPSRPERKIEPHPIARVMGWT